MRDRVVRATLVLAAALAAASAACGKKGAPEPPLRVQPEPIKAMRVRQIGDRVVVSFPRPARRTDGSALPEGTELELLMTVREPPPRSPREVQDSPSVRWAFPDTAWDDYAKDKQLEVSVSLQKIASALEMPGGAAGLNGRALAFIAGLREPGKRHPVVGGLGTMRVCLAPTAAAQVETRAQEPGIQVTWQAAAEPLPGPARSGFRVYRRPLSDPHAGETLLTPAPVTDTVFLDTAFHPGDRYRYVVRSVAADSPTCESAGGESPEVAWVDTFPPEPPQGVAAVEEVGSIRLFWRPNRESDLRGYRVYRGEGADGTLSPMFTEPVVETSWIDTTSVPGVVYSYAVSALDDAEPPNESPLSERAEGRLEETR